MKWVEGTCECGKTIRRRSPVPMIVECDCYKYCPLCGAEMAPYTPDLNPRTYRDEKNIDPLGIAEQNEASIDTFYVCYNHTPPYYSSQKPVEVELS